MLLIFQALALLLLGSIVLILLGLMPRALSRRLLFLENIEMIVSRKRCLSTTGQIIRSDIESYSEVDSIQYRVFIEYRYEVNNKVYTSTRLSLDGYFRLTDRFQTDEIKRAEIRRSTYVLGKKVTVFYHLQDPQKATLSIDFGWFEAIPVALLLIGAVLLLFLS